MTETEQERQDRIAREQAAERERQANRTADGDAQRVQEVADRNRESEGRS